MKNMDEIEYLEEYEDLILPTMSSHSTVTKNRASTNQITSNMADDEDSSSIDQDIFESLFDDHSDDESIMHGKKVPAKLSQRSERSSRVSRMSMDSIDMLVKDLGEPLNAAVDQQSKSTNKPMTKPSNSKVNQSTGKVMPKAAPTKPTSTPSHTSKATDNQIGNKSEESTSKASIIDERNAKTKSVATVRPTVQQQSGQISANKQTSSNAGATTSSTTTIRTSLSATSACSKQDVKESASLSSSVKSTTATLTSTSALLSRKQVAAATSTTDGSTNVNASSVTLAKSNRIIEPSQTTIVKPEKPQIKDPAEDPLSLENVDNETDSDTESFLYSDISADTFVSLSDVDDDEERQVIELSNDSNYDRVNLDKIRGTTPSPTVSEDDKSEDSSMKVLSKRDDTTTEGSALEINANAANISASDVEPPTSSQNILETTPTKNYETKTESVDKSPNVSDANLIERIDTVLSVTNTEKDEQAREEELAIDVGAELNVVAESNNTMHEDANVETPILPGSEMECSNAMDVDNDAAANTTDEGIQEPSKENTTTMDKEMQKGQNDEEFTAEEEVEEGIEENEEYEEMVEGETDYDESNEVNTSSEAVDNLPNENDENNKQLISEAGGHIVESIGDDNADKGNLENSQELQEGQSSEMVTLIESGTPQSENDTYVTTEENAVEENSEVEKESSNKNNEESEEKEKCELKNTAATSRTENEGVEAITNEEMKPQSGKVNKKLRESSNDDELTNKISDGNTAEKKDIEKNIKDELKVLEKTTEIPKDGEQMIEKSNENYVDILDESLEKEQKGNQELVNENTEEHPEYEAKGKGNVIQSFETKVDTDKPKERPRNSESSEVDSRIEGKPESSLIKEETKGYNLNDIGSKICESLDVKDENQLIKEKQEMASSSKNAQILEDQRITNARIPIKSRRQANSGKKSHAPRNRKTESITDYDNKSPAEISISNDTKDREVNKDVRLSRRETAGTKEVIKSRKDESKTKEAKTDETETKRNTKELIQDGPTPSNKSKIRKASNETNKEDNNRKEESTPKASISGTNKTETSETQQRKTRFKDRNSLNSQEEDYNIERRSRSQISQSKKTTKTGTEKEIGLEKPTIQDEKQDKTALNDNIITEGDQPDKIHVSLIDNENIIENLVKETQKNKADTTTNFDDDQPKQSEICEEKVLNPPLTPKPDRRIRGLVVSLKKTDLSKVLNEKLIRNKESMGNISMSLSENVSMDDKKGPMGKNARNVEKNKEDSNESLGSSQHIKSVEEDNTKDATIVYKEKLEAEIESCPSVERDNKNESESEIASTSKAAPENADTIGCADNPKRRPVESKQQEKQKKVEFGIALNKDLNARAIEMDKNSIKKEETKAIIESSDATKEKELSGERSDKEELKAAEKPSNETDKLEEEVKPSKRRRDRKTRSRASGKNSIRKSVNTLQTAEEGIDTTAPIQAHSKMEKQEIDEAVPNTPAKETDKQLEQQTVSNAATENANKPHLLNSDAKVVESTDGSPTSPIIGEPKTAISGSIDSEDKNTESVEVTDDGEDEERQTVFEPKTLRKRTNNPLDKNVKQQEEQEHSEKGLEAEKVIEDNYKAEENFFEPKTLRKRSDKKVKPQEVAEGNKPGSEVEEVHQQQQENDRAEDNVFEPKTLRKRLPNPSDKNVTSQEEEKEGAEVEKVMEDNDKAKENIFEPKNLRKRSDKKVKPQEVAEDKEERTEAEEVQQQQDNERAEERIFEPKTLRKRIDKKIKPQEVAEGKEEEAEEVTDDKGKAEENVFEPKTLRKRLDKKIKPQEVAEDKERTEAEKVIDDNGKSEETTFEPKTLRKRLNNPLDKKIKSQEVEEGKEEVTDTEKTIQDIDKGEQIIFEPKTLRRRLNTPSDNKANPVEVADGKDNLQGQGVPSKTTAKEVPKSSDKKTEAETLEDKTEENIVEAKTLRRRGQTKMGNKADDKPVRKNPTPETAVEELSDSNVLTQEAKPSEEDKAQENMVEAKTLRKKLNKTLEIIEQQRVVIEYADTTEVQAAKEVLDGKDNTQGVKTMEMDKLLCENVESEDKCKTQELIVEPKALRRRAIREHEKKEEEQRLVLAGPDPTREKEAELADTSINETLGEKESAEQLNENVDATQGEDATTKKYAGPEIFTGSVDETERIAEDKPTEERNSSTFNTNTETETETESAAEKEIKRSPSKSLRERTKKPVHKKPEPTIGNIIEESISEVVVGTENVDGKQETDITVTETVSATTILSFSKEENEGKDEVEIKNKIDEGREGPEVEKDSEETPFTEDKNLKPTSSKRPSRRRGQNELSANETQESQDHVKKLEDATKQNDQHEEEVAQNANTPVPKGNSEFEELDVSGSSEAVRTLRTRQLRQQTEASITTPSPVTTPAHSITAGSEDDHEISNRRSLRKRGADQSPSNINELARKGFKATPSTSGTNTGTIAQKLTREQLSANRSLTVTPTSALATRKRGRDIPLHNTTAEKTDPDKSPSEKKTKLESLRKSRVHNDGAETSESEMEASASQRRSRLSGVKNNPTNKNVRDNSASLERKVTQPANKQNAETDLNAPSLGSISPRKRDRAAPHNTNVAKSQTTTTTDANKKRNKLDNMHPERQTGTKHADAEANKTDVDPLQIPTKRLRRLPATDGYEVINANEDSNIPKRKSLRAVAEGNKTQQLEQQQQKSVAKKTDSTVGVTATKSGNNDASKSASTNRSTTSALKTQTSPTKSSPASKVLTFTEWLEQQKRNGDSNGGEEIATEEGISSQINAKTNTSTTATGTPKNLAVNSNLDAEKANVFTETSYSKPTDVMSMSFEKELRQRPNVREVRDAIKRKEQIMTSQNKAQNVTTNEMAQSSTTVAASRQIRVDKTVAHGTNSTNATTNTKSAANRTTQFKRPPLPQKQTSRSTAQRAGGNRMPASMEGSKNSAPQQGKQAALHNVSIKSKVRKLRVRINRSTVPAYFKKLNFALSRGQVKNDVEQKFLTATDTALPENTKKEQRQSLPISQKRVTIKSSIHPQKQQLPTLTARPTVAAASSTNNMPRVGGSLPALTKVPSSIERTTTRPQDDFNTSNNTASGYQHNNAEELSLLTPMKSVAVPLATTSSRSQHQQQKFQTSSNTAAEAIREKRTSATSSTDTVNNTTRAQVNVVASNTNSSISKEATTAPFTPFVPKEEIADEQQQQPSQTVLRTSSTNATSAAAADSSTVSTNSLASRTLAIAAATNSALSQPPTSDPSGYYGLTPTQIDSNGTRLYSFLHPAKYNRNHGCVLLDYCCPNLDGPMPAIDPTRIHAQVQAGVRELPAYIVMTTKLITRADLEANKSVIPASIRQKVEKITADAQTVANQLTLPPAAAVNGTPNIQNLLPSSKPHTLPTAAGASTSATAKSTLTPTITALQKHLPSTTSITAKLMPPTLTSSTSTSAATIPTTSTSLNALNNSTPTTSSHQMLLSDYQRSLLRTSVRQFDARLKKYYYRIALLSFSDRQKIIDNLITTTTLVPKDVECAVRLLDEYAAQISLLPSPPAVSGGPMNTKPTSVVAQALPHQQLSSASKAIMTPTTNTVAIRSNTIQKQLQQNQRNSNGQGAVLDKDNSLLGYQLSSSTSATMELNKSTVSTRSSIMSTGFKNTSMPNVSTASSGNLPALKSAQESPRIFYTKHPMQTSTPNPTTTNSGNNSMSGSKSISLRSTPRLGRELTVRQIPSKLASVSSTSVTSTPPTTRRFPTLTRNPHLLTSNATTVNSSTSETITTRSAVTISTAPKRMTRASAAAKVIVITQNREGGTNTPSDECILPDSHDNTEIKREKIDDDFVGAN